MYMMVEVLGLNVNYHQNLLTKEIVTQRAMISVISPFLICSSMAHRALLPGSSPPVTIRYPFEDSPSGNLVSDSLQCGYSHSVHVVLRARSTPSCLSIEGLESRLGSITYILYDASPSIRFPASLASNLYWILMSRSLRLF